MRALGRCIGSLAVLLGVGIPAVQASPVTTREVQEIGLAPLYTALFAVSNCPKLTIDEARFLKASRSYHLTSEDFMPTGPFAPDIAEISKTLKTRLLDDRRAFCSAYDLALAVPEGILRRR